GVVIPDDGVESAAAARSAPKFRLGSGVEFVGADGSAEDLVLTVHGSPPWGVACRTCTTSIDNIRHPLKDVLPRPTGMPESSGQHRDDGGDLGFGLHQPLD